VFLHRGQQGHGAVVPQASCSPHLFLVRKGEADNIVRASTRHPNLAQDLKILLELSGRRAEGAAGDGETSTSILQDLVQASLDSMEGCGWKVRPTCFLHSDVKVLQEFIELDCWDLEEEEGERCVRVLVGRKCITGEEDMFRASPCSV